MIQPATEENKEKISICWMEPTQQDSTEFYMDRVKYYKNKGDAGVTGPNIHELIMDTYVGPAFVEMANMQVQLFRSPFLYSKTLILCFDAFVDFDIENKFRYRKNNFDIEKLITLIKIL